MLNSFLKFKPQRKRSNAPKKEPYVVIKCLLGNVFEWLSTGLNRFELLLDLGLVELYML